MQDTSLFPHHEHYVPVGVTAFIIILILAYVILKEWYKRL
jgi:hypothetical protein